MLKKVDFGKKDIVCKRCKRVGLEMRGEYCM